MTEQVSVLELQQGDKVFIYKEKPAFQLRAGFERIFMACRAVTPQMPMPIHPACRPEVVLMAEVIEVDEIDTAKWIVTDWRTRQIISGGLVTNRVAPNEWVYVLVSIEDRGKEEEEEEFEEFEV